MLPNTSIFKDLLPQVVATLLGSLMAISDGMTYGWTSPMVPYFMSNQTHIVITASDGEWMETVNLLGDIVGLPFTIVGVEYFGRKMSMIFSAIVGCACWLMLLVTIDLKVIFVSRFLSGMAGDMCFVAAPMYVAEIADHRIRGFLSALIYLMMVVGITIVYTTGALAPYYVTPTIGIILTSLQCVFFPFMPESPYYFVYKNKTTKAKEALKRFRGDRNIDAELKKIQNAVEREKAEKGRPQDLILIPSNRTILLMMLILNGAQNFVGITVILMKLHQILEDAGSVYIKSSDAAIIFALVMLISTSIASAIIDKFGRKFLLITSSALTGIALGITTAYFHLKSLGYDVVFVSWIPAACIMVYAATFKIGLGLVPIVVIAEIFPTTIKSIGMMLADAVYIIAAVISINLYSVLYGRYGIHVPFYMFTICSFSMVFFTIFYIPETKGKTLEEIQLMLKSQDVIKKNKNAKNFV